MPLYRVGAVVEFSTYMLVNAEDMESAVDFAYEEGFPDVVLTRSPHGRSDWPVMAGDMGEWQIRETAKEVKNNG